MPCRKSVVKAEKSPGMDGDFRLIVDEGNSHTKVAVTQGDRIIDFAHLEHCDVESVMEFVGSRRLRSAIVCSVVGIDARFVESLRMAAGGMVVVLTSETPLPIGIGYATPETLGHDRVADAVGAVSLFPGEPLFVADAGSALTSDVVSADGMFEGGNITPGLSMRFRALAEFTGCLPSVTYKEGRIDTFGTSTGDAIRSGVVRGMAAEITAFARDAQAVYGARKAIFTGGHAEFLTRHLSIPEMEVIYEPMLLIKGLNRILIYNEKI